MHAAKKYVNTWAEPRKLRSIGNRDGVGISDEVRFRAAIWPSDIVKSLCEVKVPMPGHVPSTGLFNSSKSFTEFLYSKNVCIQKIIFHIESSNIRI